MEDHCRFFLGTARVKQPKDPSTLDSTRVPKEEAGGEEEESLGVANYVTPNTARFAIEELLSALPA